MGTLDEIAGLGDDPGFVVDHENIPDEPGGYTPTPPPGTYRFRLPADLRDVWEGFEATIKEQKVPRIRALLEGVNSLTITHSKTGAQTGDSFRTRISNAERLRNKAQDLYASDMLYLLRALGEEGPWPNNKAYAESLIKHASAEFEANIEWSAWCNKNKGVRVQQTDEEGNTTLVVNEEQMGCGARVYQRDIPQDENNNFVEQFGCPDCGAVLRAFANLGQFKPVSK